MAASDRRRPGTSDRRSPQVRRDLGGRLEVANVNAPGQVVVAGGKDDLEWLAENGSGLGIRTSGTARSGWGVSQPVHGPGAGPS